MAVSLSFNIIWSGARVPGSHATIIECSVAKDYSLGSYKVRGAIRGCDFIYRSKITVLTLIKVLIMRIGRREAVICLCNVSLWHYLFTAYWYIAQCTVLCVYRLKVIWINHTFQDGSYVLWLLWHLVFPPHVNTPQFGHLKFRWNASYPHENAVLARVKVLNL